MATADRSNLVLMGRIGAAHGIKGEVRVQSFTEEPLDLLAYNPFATNRPGLTVTIAKARGATNMLVAQVEGIADRNAAEKLNGVELYVERTRLPEPEDAEDYYHTDLLGLRVQLQDGTTIGEVTAVPNYGAGDILEVRNAKGETFLYPFTRQVVPAIHLKDGFLVVEPPVDADPGEEEPG